MTAGWTAGGVRARAMLAGTPQRRRARQAAAAPTLRSAVDRLGLSGDLAGDLDQPGGLGSVQRSVWGSLLWNLRVLAGWIPRPEIVRCLAAGFEIANIEGLAITLAGGSAREPFALGGLATAWPVVREAESGEALRRRLAGTAWGDPGAADAWSIGIALRLSWAERVARTVPPAATCARSAAAQLVARERWLARRQLPVAAERRVQRLLGRAAAHAATLEEFRAGLSDDCAAAVPAVATGEEFWRAETAWWRRLDRTGEALVRTAPPGRRSVVGYVMRAAAATRRLQAALELAERGGGPEVFDAVA